jgi:hypothetical protein
LAAAVTSKFSKKLSNFYEAAKKADDKAELACCNEHEKGTRRNSNSN